jgi:hypothetical protein
MRVEKGFMQLRDATVDLLVQYSTVQKESGLLKVNPIHDKTCVKSDFMQSRDAKTAIRHQKPDTSIGYCKGYGYQKDRNRMGSEDLVERQEKDWSKGYRDADSGVRGSLEKLQDKERIKYKDRF